MHFLGLAGMPRRISNYPDIFWELNAWCSFGSTLSFLSLFIFFFGIYVSFFYYDSKDYFLIQKINFCKKSSTMFISFFCLIRNFYSNIVDSCKKIKFTENYKFFLSLCLVSTNIKGSITGEDSIVATRTKAIMGDSRKSIYGGGSNADSYAECQEQIKEALSKCATDKPIVGNSDIPAEFEAYNAKMCATKHEDVSNKFMTELIDLIKNKESSKILEESFFGDAHFFASQPMFGSNNDFELYKNQKFSIFNQFSFSDSANIYADNIYMFHNELMVTLFFILLLLFYIFGISIFLFRSNRCYNFYF